MSVKGVHLIVFPNDSCDSTVLLTQLKQVAARMHLETDYSNDE